MCLHLKLTNLKRGAQNGNISEPHALSDNVMHWPAYGGRVYYTVGRFHGVKHEEC